MARERKIDLAPRPFASGMTIVNGMKDGKPCTWIEVVYEHDGGDDYWMYEVNDGTADKFLKRFTEKLEQAKGGPAAPPGLVVPGRPGG